VTESPGLREWVRLRDALETFASWDSGTQASAHIRSLDWYVSCRLVVEGGFLPQDIRPRPPFTATKQNGRWILAYDPEVGDPRKRTVLGGLKTKNVDVVVAQNGVGPVMAISTKGTLKAFRNLTNRMEEAVGDCTNLHIAYPALVYGFLHVLRGTRDEPGLPRDDVAVSESGTVSESIRRYHDVLVRLADRSDMRSDATKYEAVALALVDPEEGSIGTVMDSFPPEDSPLLLCGFFEKLYRQYDTRFVFAAPGLEATTRRLEWSSDSPLLDDTASCDGDYAPRIVQSE